MERKVLNKKLLKRATEGNSRGGNGTVKKQQAIKRRPAPPPATRIKDSKALSEMPDDSELVFGKKTTEYASNTQSSTATSKPLGYVFGRPTKYDPSYCQEVVRMGYNGYTKEQMAPELKVKLSTLYEWESKHSDFSEAMEEAVNLAQAYMERKALEALDKPTSAFNHTLWSKIVSCRFPRTYRNVERKEIGGIEGKPIPIATASTQITGENLQEFYKSLMDGNK